MFHLRKLVAIALLSTSLTAVGESFTLSSQDISEDAFMPKAQEYGGFGCSGEDMSPQLQWANVPEGTKSFCDNGL